MKKFAFFEKSKKEKHSEQQISEVEKPEVPADGLRLFISYGHEEENEPIVMDIKKHLEKRKHSVWLDQENIPHGSDWRRKIRDGIVDSESVVSFLSQHAVREENGVKGVCLDELSIALSIPEKTIITILLEPREKVKIPPTISSIQWLDMSDWKEKYEAGEKVYREYFDEKFAMILDVLESKESFQFHGEVESLRRSLLPETGRRRYYELLSKEMVGRRWLSEKFTEYLEERNESRFFCIYGGPGYGKSKFIAHASHYNPQVVAAYFFEWDFQNKFSVKTFICSIAFQMATMLPAYRSALIQKLKDNGRYIETESPDRKNSNSDWLMGKTDAALFDFLITDIIVIDGNIDNKVIVIDAVDEAVFEGENPLAQLLCSETVGRLPAWLKIVLTARDEEDIRLFFQKIDAKEISMDCDESEKDIEEYLRKRLKPYIEKGDISEETIKRVTERCEKTFIFAEKLCDVYEKLDKSILSDESKLPKNINGLYYYYFSRLFRTESYEKVREPLDLLAANNGGMSVPIFMQIMGWNDAQFEKFLKLMRSFVKKATDDEGQRITFYHKTINEWIINEAAGEYTADKENGRKLILEFCKNCEDQLTAAEFSWGFNGSKPKFPLETLFFVYSKVMEFGDGSMKMGLLTDLRFLYELQLETYKNSKMKLSGETASQIESSYNLMTPAERKEKERYLAGSKIISAETEMTKGNTAVALDLFKDAEKQFSECLKNEHALYSCVERNICFLTRKTDKNEAERRLKKLMEYLDDKEYPERFSDKANYNYHLGVIHYDQGKYEEALEEEKEAVRLAKSFNEIPDRLCVLAYNQIGSCYQRLCCELSSDHPEERLKYVQLQNEFKKKSLDERLKLYGKYNHYTANAYDYMARAILDLHREKKEPLGSEAYDHVDTAIKITAYTLGPKSAAYARALQTKAILLEYDGRLEEAFAYAEESLELYRTFGQSEKRAAENTQRIFDRIKTGLDKKNQADKPDGQSPQSDSD